jgi:hypothetical protein
VLAGGVVVTGGVVIGVLLHAAKKTVAAMATFNVVCL